MCKTPAFLDGSLSLNFKHVLGYLFATSEEESKCASASGLLCKHVLSNCHRIVNLNKYKSL